MKKRREKLFSITQKDLKFDYFRGSGPGGQHRNKTDTACRCTHPASGAVGTSQEFKSQKQNKEAAFGRMAKSDKLKKWIRLEASRKLGVLDKIKDEVEQEMKNVRVEGKDEKGRWTELTGNEI